jgi:hypothetical protein
LNRREPFDELPDVPPDWALQTPHHAAKPDAGRQTRNDTRPRPDSPSWIAATAIGNAGVRRVRAAILAHFPGVVGVAVLGTDPESQARGDLCITQRDGRRWCCEVKTDDRANQSGNLAIETQRRHGPGMIGTGITTSHAQLWAFVLADRIVFVDAPELRALVAHKRAMGECTERAMGDGGRSLCMLVPIVEVEQVAGAFVVRDGGGA